MPQAAGPYSSVCKRAKMVSITAPSHLVTVEQLGVALPPRGAGCIFINVGGGGLDFLVTADALLAHRQGLMGFAVLYFPVAQSLASSH